MLCSLHDNKLYALPCNQRTGKHEHLHHDALTVCSTRSVLLQAIREWLKQCEEADAARAIAPEHFDADGEIDSAHIRCAGCSNPDSSDDNDILLCDGQLCSKAYHVSCLPVKETFDMEQLPDDVGWLCPACDCRYDILWNLAENFELDYDELTPLPCAPAYLARTALPMRAAGAPASRMLCMHTHVACACLHARTVTCRAASWQLRKYVHCICSVHCH